jgi:hypothetical protein
MDMDIQLNIQGTCRTGGKTMCIDNNVQTGHSFHRENTLSRGDLGPNKPGLPLSGTSRVGSMVIDGGLGCIAGSAC